MFYLDSKKWQTNVLCKFPSQCHCALKIYIQNNYIVIKLLKSSCHIIKNIELNLLVMTHRTPLHVWDVWTKVFLYAPWFLYWCHKMECVYVYICMCGCVNYLKSVA
jgi:hypothetical protein